MKKAFLLALACLLLPLGTAAATKKAKPKPTVAPTAEATKEPEKPAATPAPTPEPTKEEPKAEATPEAEKAAEPAQKAEADTRSNGLAVTLAIIPGIAVHGTGHLYAGSYLKGAGLILVEAGAVWAGLRYYEQFSKDLDKLRNAGDAAKNGVNISGAISSVGIMSVAAFGFIWSWVDDMFGASTAVDIYNKKAQAKMQAKLNVLPYNDGAALAVSTRF